MNNAKKQNEIENKCVERLKKNISIANSYGLSLEDYSEFELLIDKITPNKNSNDFPDFILDEGFVEHFVIT
ncbi:hypothetical protein RAK27_18535 [Carnobacterium maltaromaticum]|uniref:Uncharacterized protein n=1 Tax=Carnobacterium maltaromaticum TaxID=2751 RepID=A0AAW9JVU8_CARML|nr:hypothetical protein [Carnobacterium maltaromaticum]MDZ5760642.1 hypothetical protein [Carnobacterium maltaromaticum]